MLKPYERRMHFLARLIRREKLEKIVELGIRDDNAYFFLLEKCPGIKLVGIDTRNKVTYVKNEPNKRAERYGARAMLLKGDTDEFVDQFIDNSVDLIFIDIDHTYDSIKIHILNWRPKIRSGGFLTGHDIHWPEVRDAVDEFVIQYEVGPDNVWYTKIKR